MGRPVVGWIEHHARRTPDRVALVDLHRARQLTHRELADRVRAPAWALAERHGVGNGLPVDAAVQVGLRENAAHA
jgi:fatty-acyl-CoA synthase